jgi:SDR family mycofactocin-dependent oxidoreductase
MGRLDKKVAFITGAARGQGRSHALRLAEEGASIIAIDLCSQPKTGPYATATEADLAETVKLVEAKDRRILARKVDVRDSAGLQKVVDEGIKEFGGIDIVSANAGIFSFAPAWELTDEQWDEMVAVNLTGVWKTVRAAIPSMIKRGKGGSLVLTSSTAGRVAFGNLAHYTAAKHGVVGLMKTLAVELAPHNIRCNTIHPTTVKTDMILNDAAYNLFMPGQKYTTPEQAAPAFQGLNALKIPWVEPVDISNALLFLASDESRYVTGTEMVVDAGGTAPYKFPHA